MKDFARWTYNILQYAGSHWINLNHPLTFAHLVYQTCVEINGQPRPQKHRLGPKGFRKHETRNTSNTPELRHCYLPFFQGVKCGQKGIVKAVGVPGEPDRESGEPVIVS